MDSITWILSSATIKSTAYLQLIEGIEVSNAVKHSRLEVLKEKMSLLSANKQLGSNNQSIDIEMLQRAVSYYDQVLMEITNEKLNINSELKENELRIIALRNQIRDFQNDEAQPSSEILIKVQADKPTTAYFTVTYLVQNAGWFPKYDLRLNDISSPLRLHYKAELYQNTGVDWKDVKLSFSNGNPNQSGVAPELSTWYLNFDRNTVYHYNEHEITVNRDVRSVQGRVLSAEEGPLPGVNVVVKGTTVGTITDLDGYYDLTLPNNATMLAFSSVGFVSEDMPITSNQIDVVMTPDVTRLEEVVVTGYAAGIYGSRSPRSYSKPKEAKRIITTKVVNQTTVEFALESPYSLKTNSDNLTVDLKMHELETIYEYYAVPKLDKDAFLIARIVNWDQYDLLDGEANLYFEETYVGRSVLNAHMLADTLDVSFGRDKNIVIGREKSQTFTKRTALGSNKLETRGFQILARNKKEQPIQLTIFDQVPVSVLNDIEVKTTELSNGEIEESTGIISWRLTIQAQSQEDLKLAYEVKYPKREIVSLE